MKPASSMDDVPAYAAAFTSALLNPERPPPASVAGPSGKAATKRYGVYRNNVTVSLINALAAVFPATQRITGPDFFREMARTHVRTTPPTSPLLFEYGREFPDFVQQYEHAKSLPWLADVARIERAWLDAYHAADAAPLAFTTLAAVPSEQLMNLTLIVHPATRIVRSRFSALTVFSANRVDEPVPKIDASEPEDTLVTRPKLEVMARQLPAGGAAFLNALIAGEPLGTAASAALEEAGAGFDLGGNIAGMIDAGVFVGVSRGSHNVG
ncbi:MAG: DUF2063 domain-containing protein [Bauldia sp.]